MIGSFFVLACPNLLALDTDAAVWVNAFAALGSTVAAGAAAWAAWRSWRTSKSLEGIERSRWHADRTPQFEVEAHLSIGHVVLMQVDFVGPSFLDRLADVTISIRDSQYRLERAPYEGGETPPPADQIYGPYCFYEQVPGMPQTCPSHRPIGRTAERFSVRLSEGRSFMLGPTDPPPHWGDLAQGLWRKTYRNDPIRLTLRCTRIGEAAWIVPVEVMLRPLATVEPAA